MLRKLVRIDNSSILATTIALTGFLALDCQKNRLLAQIVPDETLGAESSIVTPNVDINGNGVDRIDGGAKRDANLFHSFREFNLNDGQRVYFANPEGVKNIFSRVTGSNISEILGTLGVNGGANLFLLNPNGIIFGANARLDVRGSFVTSTADSIVFGNNFSFSATNPESVPILKIDVPLGLQFGTNPGSILVRGDGKGLRNNNSPEIDTNDALRVDRDRTLAIIGGDLILEGATLKTAGGRIELGSVTGAGNVSLTETDKGFSLNYDAITNFGDIQLSQATSVDASGNSAGEIQMHGKNITVRGGSQVESTTLETGLGGKIKIIASDLVELSGTTADNPQDSRKNPSSVSIDNRKTGESPGELTINTKRLVVREGGRISGSNTTTGVGANITINASDSVELIGTFTSSGGLRPSGISVQNRGDGMAGDLTINTTRLIILDGAEASASTFGAGDGGNIIVNASEAVEVIGTSSDGTLQSRLTARVGNPNEISNPGGGNGGNSGSGGGNGSNSGSGGGNGGDVEPSLPATGKGGDLTINTRQLTVSDGAEVNVSSESVAVQESVGISQSPEGAGNLTITAERIDLDTGGEIKAETDSGQGGNITLKIADILLLGRASSISTTAGTPEQNGNPRIPGDGGNITLDADFIVALSNEDSRIIADAFGGAGGNINITTNNIFGESSLIISASSDLGKDGIININTPQEDPSHKEIELPEQIVDVASLIDRNLCVAGQGSEFILTGRGGLPSSPKDLINPAPAWEDWRLVETANGNSRETETSISSKKNNRIPTKIIEVQGWSISANGKIILTAQPDAVIPQNSRSATGRTQCAPTY
jgi:filamentous hemagglutinin family protein